MNVPNRETPPAARFPSGDSLERISWDEWFQQFDGNDLALLHRDFKHEDGEPDRFNKLVSRKTAD